ncbi:MAG: apolipoprotein N-acyltransferase [Betaproteobacteria bacterium]|nr:apolipoprotein N-acyltransferase [Betaproteobacteria bacterium]
MRAPHHGILGFVLGALAFLCFAPHGLYALMVVLLGAIAYLGARTANWLRAAALGYVFGLGYFLFGVSWVYISMHEFGGMAMPVAAFATLLFCAYLALFPAMACAILGARRIPAAVRILVMFPAFWALSEWLRGWFFTGFPWLATGYTQITQSGATPLGQYAPLLGVYGVSWLCALSGAAIAWIVSTFMDKRMAQFGVGAALLAIIVATGAVLGQVRWTQAVGAPTSVALVQGNIEQSMKWRPEVARSTLDTYLGLALSSKQSLILLPETALPMFNVDIPPEYFRLLGEHAKSNGGDILLGVPEYAGPQRYYNSVMSFGTAPTQIYRKHHLVPFGDYFPKWPVLAWIMGALQIPMSDFSRGEAIQQPLAVAGQRVAANICYEDVFGEEIIRQLPAATLLANFTNDAWWGKSNASEQHGQMSQMRAKEAGRYMLRATNTGVSAIIGEDGAVLASAAQFTQTTLVGSVQGFTGATPFSRWGNAAFLVLTGIAVILGLSTMASQSRR